MVNSMKNLKAILIVLALICLTEISFSQELLWQKIYVPEQDGRFVSPALINIDSEFLMVNLIRKADFSDNMGSNKFLITKLDSNGDTIWNKNLFLSRNVKGFSNLIKYNDNEYMIYGRWNNSLLYRVVFNGSGELISEKYMDNTVDLNGYGWFNVSPEREFLVSVGKINQGNIYIFNKDLDILDSLNLYFENEDTSILNPSYFPVIQCKTEDNGYLISNYQIYPHKYNYLIKTDNSLNIQWTQKYDARLLNNDWEKFIFRYIYHSYDDGTLLCIMNNSNPLGDSTFAILKLDNTGNILSTKFYGKRLIYDLNKPQPSISSMLVTNMVNTYDGGYLLGINYRLPTIAKINNNCDLEWLSSYSVPDTNIPYGLSDIIQISDNNYILSISEYSAQSPEGYNYSNITYLYKISNNASDVDNNITKNQIIDIFPNPAHDFIQLHFTDAVKLSDVEIYNVLGIKVLETDYKDRIDVSRLSAGVYFLKAGDRVYKFVKM